MFHSVHAWQRCPTIKCSCSRISAFKLSDSTDWGKGPQSWPPRSLNISLPWFLFCWHLKFPIYTTPIRNMEHLRIRIIESCHYPKYSGNLRMTQSMLKRLKRRLDWSRRWLLSVFIVKKNYVILFAEFWWNSTWKYIFSSSTTYCFEVCEVLLFKSNSS